MSSFVKKEWLFDKISGKTSTVPTAQREESRLVQRRRILGTIRCCAKSTDNRRVSVTLDDTCENPLPYPRTVDMVGCACDKPSLCGKEIVM